MGKEFTKISAPVEGEYEGHPTVSIPLASGKPFTFGVEKAAAILKWLDAVKTFSAKHPAGIPKIDKRVVASMTAQERAELAALLAATS